MRIHDTSLPCQQSLAASHANASDHSQWQVRLVLLLLVVLGSMAVPCWADAPPVVTLNTPEEYASFNTHQSVIFDATATDDIGVESVQFFIARYQDAAWVPYLTPTGTAAPDNHYTYDTSTMADGLYQVYAVATDTHDHTGGNVSCLCGRDGR